MIRLLELLRARGYEPDPNRVKLVRHKDARYQEALKQRDALELYQRYQSRPIFHDCDQIITFLGEDRGTRFVGVYDVGKYSKASEVPFPSELKYMEWARPEHYHYELKKRPSFEDLEDRLVIEWGKAALSWHQWFTDRVVIEIRPMGRVLPPFEDYLRVHLSFEELRQMARNAEAHRDWVAALSAVGGIYLIVNGLTGEQYVGSATGEQGIWQRWCEYARSGHGENKKLRELCDRDERCPQAFSFSILDTFSRTLSRECALENEAFFKAKLGTKSHGLNLN